MLHVSEWCLLWLLTHTVPCNSTSIQKCVANSRCLVQSKTLDVVCVQSCFKDNGGCSSDRVCINTMQECSSTYGGYQCSSQVQCLQLNGNEMFVLHATCSTLQYQSSVLQCLPILVHTTNTSRCYACIKKIIAGVLYKRFFQRKDTIVCSSIFKLGDLGHLHILTIIINTGEK